MVCNMGHAIRNTSKRPWAKAAPKSIEIEFLTVHLFAPLMRYSEGARDCLVSGWKVYATDMLCKKIFAGKCTVYNRLAGAYVMPTAFAWRC